MSDLVSSFSALKLVDDAQYVEKVKGLSTIYRIDVEPGSIAYRYDVEIVKKVEKTGREKILTKQNDEGLKTLQRQCCSDLIESLYGMTDGFGNNTPYTYDGKRILFVTKKLALSQSTFELRPENMKRRTSMFLRNEPVQITITPNERVQQFDYSVFDDAVVYDVQNQSDHSARTFLEVLTSQYLINSGKYQLVSAGTLFDTDVRDVDRTPGMQLRVGFKKGVRVTNLNGKLWPLMVVDMKRTAFFAQKRLADIFLDMVRDDRDENGKRRFEKFMRGVRCYPEYSPSRTFIFDKLSRPVNDRSYAVDGKSLPQFMQEKHDITLKHPAMNGAHPKQPNGQKVVYPLECIRVLEGQLIPIEKMNDGISRALLMENAIRPDERFKYVQRQAEEIGTKDAATFLAKFNVKIDLKSNNVNIGRRNGAKIIVGKGHVLTPKINGSWFQEAVDAPFIVGAKLKNWVVAYDDRGRFSDRDVKQYVNNLLRKAAQSGMEINNPVAFEGVNLDRLHLLFEKARDKKLQFILYIDDFMQKSHDRLKLYEAYYKVLTQHVVAKNLGAGAQTLKNVLMKMNLKCFGLNHIPVFEKKMEKFSLENKDLLVIGYDINAPKRASAKELFELKKIVPEADNRNPVVVGICANKNKNPWSFSGDFYYQESQKSGELKYEQLSKAISDIIASAINFGRNPTRIVIVRDGLSEGQQAIASKQEVDAVKIGFNRAFTRKEKDINVHPKFTFIVSTKSHSKRFYRQQGQNVMNTVVGDAVTSGVTRADVPEFYLQSHNPLKGMPKIPQYSVLVNELGMSMDEIQHFMLLLSNMHQVSACPISLPLPVYLADECAKRGQNIYNEILNLRSYRQQNREPFAPEIRMENEMFNFADLNEKLGYSASVLGSTRFNA